MVIHRKDRVLNLISQDEGLIEVLARLSPTLERLRNPVMRKVMSNLMTVEHVAEIAGWDPEVLVARLNDGSVPERRDGQGCSNCQGDEPVEHDRPSRLRAIPEEKVVQLDVREDLRAGREPFSKIMAARRDMPEGGALCLRATFEPIPLYAVMERQGLAHHAERRGEDDWEVWFYPAMKTESEDSATRATPFSGGEGSPREESSDQNVRILDVRGLEPPEPMIRTLEALEALSEGQTLVQLNVRVPEFLLPQLEERGFAYEIREQSTDLVRVFIRRAH